MFGGVALPLDQLTATQLYRHDLSRRVHDRNGALEVQFLARDAERLLPVFHAGELRIIRWGNRRGESAGLPLTLWTQQATIEAGGWADVNAEEVVIPAARGLDNGIWFTVKTGIRGLVVADEQGEKSVFVVCEPASNYYAVMTKDEWMPCLVDQEECGKPFPVSPGRRVALALKRLIDSLMVAGSNREPGMLAPVICCRRGVIPFQRVKTVPALVSIITN